jgi:hypothetical protein
MRVVEAGQQVDAGRARSVPFGVVAAVSCCTGAGGLLEFGRLGAYLVFVVFVASALPP